MSGTFSTIQYIAYKCINGKLGINKYVLRCIRSYLTQRTQFVAVDGCDSHMLPAVSGVPQRSVLGPLLFINEVTTVISGNSEINLFADDIVLYRTIKSQADFDQDINCVSSCISEKYLQFNINKCRQLFISQKRVYSLPPPSLLLNGQVLTQVNEYKYLGITITSNMSWSSHITNVCNKTRRQIIQTFLSELKF